MDGRVAILLRGVNVGGRNTVPMARLRELAADLGLTGVGTYVASGNLLCDAPAGGRRGLDRTCRQVEAAVLADLGVTTDAVARTHAELDAVLAAWPWPDHPDARTMVLHLGGPPADDAVADLLARDLGEDECRVVGREVYARYDGGSQGSWLSQALVTRVLGVTATARNRRTTRALLERTAAPG